MKQNSAGILSYFAVISELAWTRACLSEGALWTWGMNQLATQDQFC